MKFYAIEKLGTDTRHDNFQDVLLKITIFKNLHHAHMQYFKHKPYTIIEIVHIHLFIFISCFYSNTKHEIL